MERAVLLYDEDCGICRWAADRLLAWDRDRRLRASPIQGDEGRRLLAGIDPERRLASWHLATTDARVFSAGAAVPPLLKLLPGGGPLAALASASPATTELIYRLASRNRTRLGRVVGASACAVDPSDRT